MDKASDFESEDCEFESRRGRLFTYSFPSSYKCKLSFSRENLNDYRSAL